MALDTDELILAAEDFDSASKRLDACREALSDAEQDYADVHERLMVVAQGLDPTVNYAKEFTPRLSPRKQPQTPDPQSSEGESTEARDAVHNPAIGTKPLPTDFGGQVGEVSPQSWGDLRGLSNGTTHPEQQD